MTSSRFWAVPGGHAGYNFHEGSAWSIATSEIGQANLKDSSPVSESMSMNQWQVEISQGSESESARKVPRNTTRTVYERGSEF